MNIFTTSDCPRKSAEALDDKRVNKMIIESMQMLCTALIVNGCEDVPYKMTHKHHPCTLWASENSQHFEWLYLHMCCLAEEYKRRYNKEVDHKSFQLSKEYDIFNKGFMFLPRQTFSPFVNCTANHKHLEVHEAYRKCLIEKWQNDKIRPRWTNAVKPDWA